MKVKNKDKVYWSCDMEHINYWFELDGGQASQGYANKYYLIKYKTRNSALIMELFSHEN